MAEDRQPAANQGTGGNGAVRGVGPGGGHGPGNGPGARVRGPRPKLDNPGKLFKRVMGYTLKDYGICWVVVVICIFVSVYSSLQGTMFMRTLIDSYIAPMIGGVNPDYGPLAGAIGRVAIFYALGVAASFTQSRILINVSQ